MTGSGKELVPVKHAGGRPRGSALYTQDIADEIIDRLTIGHTLISICREDIAGNHRFKGEFPSHSVVYDWADPQHTAHIPEFALRFARAKLDQQRYWLEETIDISNTPLPGVEETLEIGGKDGNKIRRVRKDMLHHRMLQIDTRFKAIAKLNPQLWAERLQQAAPAPTDPSAAAPRLIIEGGLPEPEEEAPPPPPETPTDG